MFFQNLLAAPRSIISHEVRKQQQKNVCLLFSISRGSKKQNGRILMQKLPIFTCRITGFKI